ncbi:4-hydroxyphenylacetate 3-hydroxylase family protein [Flaviflexus massiliensis]|uniref:4-hydroxyphenylacetate 3-hydroxylase family protein n=1 Tax=Flaviflexus massiliensis TaxID=1522309 RepID=UPI0006D57EFA|nr:4-hydroxyphenylacetate 3-hydroxylase N-terminal domain-containing protein [Flaviflexus massiliensis]
MTARDGASYVESLRAMNPTVYLDGKVDSVVDHPAFAGIISSYADLYDMQVGEDKDLVTFDNNGTRTPTSFLVPQSADDLVKRRIAAQTWAEYSAGMLGRSGDYVNAGLTALAEASTWFEEADPQFGKNIRAYVKWVRDNDLLLTATVGSPQTNRAVSAAEQGGGDTALKIVAQNDDGIVVSGARMVATNAPITHEILVMPQTVLRGGVDDMPYSFAFAVPSDVEGLKLLGRRIHHRSDNEKEEPLASRFEEIDTVCIFDHVLVPWDRIFLLGHPAKSNSMFTATGATALMAHQSVTRTTVKTEFYAGLLIEMAKAIGIDSYGHIQDDIAQVLGAVQFGKSALRASEADGFINEFGFYQPNMAPLTAIRNWYPRFFPQLGHMVKKFGASGLTALPYDGDAMGEMSGDIDRYLQGRTLDGHDRVNLFNLGFDAAVSSFAGRQGLYEYYFHGDPLRMSAAYVQAADTSHPQKLVQDLLAHARNHEGSEQSQ